MFYQEALPKCYCAYFCMGAYKRDVVVVIKIARCLYLWGAYFVRVPIILVLQQSRKQYLSKLLNNL